MVHARPILARLNDYSQTAVFLYCQSRGIVMIDLLHDFRVTIGTGNTSISIGTGNNKR